MPGCKLNLVVFFDTTDVSGVMDLCENSMWDLSNLTLSDMEFSNMTGLDPIDVTPIRNVPVYIINMAVLLVYVIYATVNLLLIISILAKPEIRGNQGNWLLINMCICMLLEAILSVSSLTHKDASLPHWLEVYGLCEFVYMLFFFVSYVIPCAVLLVTIDRFVSIVSFSGTKPGLSKNAVIGSIIGSDILILLVYCIMAFALDGGYYYPTQDENFPTKEVCVLLYGSASYLVFLVLQIIWLLAVIIMTSLVIIKWCQAKSPEVTQAALPLVVANAFYIVFDLPGTLYWSVEQLGGIYLGGYEYIWYIRLGYGILVPFIWLGWSKDIRKSYVETCCPCCPGKKELGEETHLLET